jgi:hypothetical protein
MYHHPNFQQVIARERQAALLRENELDRLEAAQMASEPKSHKHVLRTAAARWARVASIARPSLQH